MPDIHRRLVLNLLFFDGAVRLRPLLLRKSLWFTTVL